MINDELMIKHSIELFHKHGTKFTMDELSFMLGVSKRTLYEHVISKENLIRIVINYYFDIINQMQLDIYHNTSLNTTEKLFKILTSLPKTSIIEYSKISDIRKEYNNLFYEIDARLNKGWEITFSLIDQGIKEGHIINCDKEIFKRIYISTIENLISNYNLIDKSYKEVLEEIVSIIINGIRTRE